MVASEIQPPAAIRHVSCQPGHRQQILRLWSSNFPATTEASKLDDLDWALRHNPDLLVLALTEDGRVAGTCLAGFDGQRGWLYYVCVDDSLRRRGIGTGLVREAERRLAAIGCRRIGLQLRHADRQLGPFYEALGYFQEAAFSYGRNIREG